MFQASLPKPSGSAKGTIAALPFLRIGLVGLGTVGAGTYRLLARNQALIAARTGCSLLITHVAVRNLVRAKAMVGTDVQVLDDPFAVVDNPDIDVVVEAIGGTTVAKDLVMQSIAKGKHVVTANKALLAEHGSEIFAAAQAQQVVVAYEGAVAVSIPIIKALREGLVGNRVACLAGIVNGTSNYILSAMADKGMRFEQALREAQALGFAESDPRLDVEGIDAAHKLSLLAANAFGTPIAFDQVRTKGIARLEVVDMHYAKHFGYRIKLLAIARRLDTGLSLSVRPTLVPADHLLGGVSGSMNGIMVRCDAAGDTFYYGAGAGSEQTASAVVADLVDVARNTQIPHRYRVPYLGTLHKAQKSLPVVRQKELCSPFYLRVHTSPSLVSQLLDRLESSGVPLLQHAMLERPEGDLPHLNLSLVVLTAAIREDRLHRALQTIGPIEVAPAQWHCLPVEERM